MYNIISVFFILITSVLPIFTPFFIYTKFYDYSTFPKAVFLTLLCFYILVVILVCLKLNIGKNIVINKKLISTEKLAFLYLLFIIISTTLSIDVNRSIIGAPLRYEGLISLTCYIIILLVITNFYRYKKYHLIFIGISAAIVSIHSTLYYFDIHIIPPYLSIVYGRDIDWSLIGHRNFLGSYLSLAFPIFAYIFIKYGNRLSFILNGLLFASLMTSLTRSAYISFAFYIVFFILYFSFKKEHNKRLIILLSSFILIFAFLNTISNNDILYRILSIKQDTVSLIKEGDDNSGSLRVFIWKNGLKLVPKYALHGSGPDTFAIPFMDNFSEEVEKSYKAKIIVDKAHNEYLQIAVTIGIPALITYLTIIGILLFKGIKISKNKSLLIPLNISFISYLIQAFFNISVVSVAPLYWALLGVICSYVKNETYLVENSGE